jgi:hypothetical protein
MAKKLCEICGVNKATVPDRNRPGRLVNRLCGDCHGLRLSGDFAVILKIRNRDRTESCGS